MGTAVRAVKLGGDGSRAGRETKSQDGHSKFRYVLPIRRQAARFRPCGRLPRPVRPAVGADVGPGTVRVGETRIAGVDER